MSKLLNLTISQAAAVRSALIGLAFEESTIHVDFAPINVFVTETGWITVRDGPHGYEEHENVSAFKYAYKLQDLEPELLALAYEMESICETHLLYAYEEGKENAVTIWGKNRDRCRAAITASIAKSTTSSKSVAVKSDASCEDGLAGT
jgi:hypothetical protein